MCFAASVVCGSLSFRPPPARSVQLAQLRFGFNSLKCPALSNQSSMLIKVCETLGPLYKDNRMNSKIISKCCATCAVLEHFFRHKTPVTDVRYKDGLARFFAEHASLQSTLLCRALSSAEHASLQSTLLCRARFFAEHTPLQSTLLCRARFFAEHSPLQSTLLCRALSFAEHSPLQSTLLCRAHFFAEHSPLQSTLLCRARFFAERTSLRGWRRVSFGRDEIFSVCEDTQLEK